MSAADVVVHLAKSVLLSFRALSWLPGIVALLGKGCRLAVPWLRGRRKLARLTCCFVGRPNSQIRR